MLSDTFDELSMGGMLCASGAMIGIDSTNTLNIEKGRRGASYKLTPLQYQLLATSLAKVQQTTHRGTIHLEMANNSHLILKKGRSVSEFFITVRSLGGTEFTAVLSKNETRLLQEKAHSLAATTVSVSKQQQ